MLALVILKWLAITVSIGTLIVFGLGACAVSGRISREEEIEHARRHGWPK